MFVKPPGIEDIFPDRIGYWNRIIDSAKEIFKIHNYKEIIVPVMEYTDVFTRGLGDTTDIVSKEMFTFEDRGKRSLTLRPEGTASVVRAYVENGDYNRLSINKFYYTGQMFRAERPQRGRLRQFNQFGAELFGSLNPYYDYEIISIVDSITKKIGIDDYNILINSIGCSECRPEFIDKLVLYYSSRKDELCNDCKNRLKKNPLRILDCKKTSCKSLKSDAPVITEYVCVNCSEHFEELKGYLVSGNIQFMEDPLLVRGLDYYTRTTFEFVTDKLGGQNAFAAGGRYDNLVKEFGGNDTPAVGFAAGIERLMLLIEDLDIKPGGIDLFLIHSGGETLKKTISLIPHISSLNISFDIDPDKSGFKPQFKRANRENAKHALIIGEDELGKNKFVLKDMGSGEQALHDLSDIKDVLLNLKK